MKNKKENERSIKRFLSNMSFMFARSWQFARSTYFFAIIRSILGTVQPFVMLIIPKYILDELVGERRIDVTLYYVGLYAAVVIFFNIANILLNRFGTIRAVKVVHEVDMYEKKKWLYMDYGNFENGQVRELAGRCVSSVDPSSFAEGKVLGFFTNLFQLAGYTYIIFGINFFEYVTYTQETT